MADIVFYSILATVSLGGLLVGWATDELPRSPAKLCVAIWVGVLLVLFYVGLYAGSPSGVEQPPLLGDKAFGTLLFLFILMLPFATWSLWEPQKKRRFDQDPDIGGSAGPAH